MNMGCDVWACIRYRVMSQYAQPGMDFERQEFFNDLCTYIANEVEINTQKEMRHEIRRD